MIKKKNSSNPFFLRDNGLLREFCIWLEKEDRENWEIERAVEELLKETIDILS